MEEELTPAEEEIFAEILEARYAYLVERVAPPTSRGWDGSSRSRAWDGFRRPSERERDAYIAEMRDIAAFLGYPDVLDTLTEVKLALIRIGIAAALAEAYEMPRVALDIGALIRQAKPEATTGPPLRDDKGPRVPAQALAVKTEFAASFEYGEFTPASKNLATPNSGNARARPRRRRPRARSPPKTTPARTAGGG